MTNEQRIMLIEQIKHSRSQQYLSAYLAAIGANIHVGEKRARKLAREAGCVALKHAASDMELDHEAFSKACQTVFNEALEAFENEQQSESSNILVPEHYAKGNNGIARP